VNFRTRWQLRVFAAAFVCISPVAAAQEAKTEAATETKVAPSSGILSDVKDYFTAPIRWDSQDWIYFGGTVAAIAVTHHYDDQVRRHFTTGQYASNLTSPNSHDLQDAAPAVAVVGATYLYAVLIRDSNGLHETGEMLEAGGLAAASGYLMKYAFGRQGPYETDNSSKFFAGGSSFPSVHSTAAFAIGTVLAESGNDDERWIRRVLGYGLGAFTSYERLRHNAHWLSDTVAGAGLGIATAHFVMNRHGPQTYVGHIGIVPIQGGAMLTYSTTLPP